MSSGKVKLGIFFNWFILIFAEPLQDNRVRVKIILLTNFKEGLSIVMSQDQGTQ